MPGLWPSKTALPPLAEQRRIVAKVERLMKTDYPLRSLCETLEVLPSGYYAWQGRASQLSIRTQEDALLVMRRSHARIHCFPELRGNRGWRGF
jgi:hypothetical protein